MESPLDDGRGLSHKSEPAAEQPQLTQTSMQATQTARYQRAVQRITAEACWLFTEQTALIALDKSGRHGLDFFRVAFYALLGDRLLRLVRIFENDTRVASFWYLYRCNPRSAALAKQHGE